MDGIAIAKNISIEAWAMLPFLLGVSRAVLAPRAHRDIPADLCDRPVWHDAFPALRVGREVASLKSGPYRSR
jgi:hypothetical protein